MLDRVARVCREVGRDPQEIRLVAVTKTVAPEVAGALAELGCTDLGENRLAELERKHAWFAASGRTVRWHFVGHVQRNKARRVVRLADEIHSVDSRALLDTLARVAAEEGRRPGIYLQVKLTDEPTKSGLSLAELPQLLTAAAATELRCRGLMTMAPLVAEGDAPAAARATFERLAALAAKLPGSAFTDGRPLLSMGMSADFETAVRAGAHVLRIGSAFFEDVRRAPTAGEAR